MSEAIMIEQLRRDFWAKAYLAAFDKTCDEQLAARAADVALKRMDAATSNTPKEQGQ